LTPVEVYTSHALPSFGAETQQMKVLKEEYDARSITLLLAAPASTTQSISIRVNSTQLRPHTDNGELAALIDGKAKLTVAFPSGPGDADGYVQKTVTIQW
jgi:hypothetical protein